MEIEPFIKLALDKTIVFFKFLRNFQKPSVVGTIEAPITYNGKTLYPVYLTFKPGSGKFFFHRIKCNCTMYLPNVPYSRYRAWTTETGEVSYYPAKLAPNPYIRTITLSKNDGCAHQLFFVDPGENKVIEFVVDEGKTGWFQVTMTWSQSVA